MAWLIGRGFTTLPKAAEAPSRAIATAVSTALGGNLGSGKPIAHLLRGYLQAAGIQAGYSYFAPNVSDSYRLLFELHYQEGRVEYEAFAPDNRETDLRLAGLLDEVIKTHSDALREVIVKLLVQSVWQRYPEVAHVRAVLAAWQMPSAAEYREGARGSYKFLYAYDFSLTGQEMAPERGEE
ncbi:MAG: hypothetical protein ACR2ID_01110 [Chthoniobacterales bacterium]